MLFSDASHIEVTLDPTDGRYGLAFSHNYPTHTAASIRDTPISSSQSPSMSSTLGRTSQLFTEGRSFLRYPVPDMREVQPGVLATGQWTVNHPFVDAYLAALARLAPQHKPQQGPRPSAPSTTTTSPAVASQELPDVRPAPSASALHAALPSPSQDDAEKLRWRAQHGGIAACTTVAQVITVQYQLFPGPGSAWYAAQVPRLSEEKKKVIFALAALKVMNHPTHPAHWALWAKNVLRRTAQVVEEILQLKPCPVVSRVAWLGIPESIWSLHGLQSTFIPPPPPQPEKPKAGGMTLRKRKAPTTSSTATRAEDAVALRVSPRKRQRTTRAQAALAQTQAQDASVAAASPSAADSNSTLLDIPLPIPSTSGAGGISKAMKREMVEVAGASPALQPLELPLAIPDSANVTASTSSTSLPTINNSSSSASTTTPSSTTVSLSPSVTRRSTRPRRKPAQGPVTLSAPSPSTPLSTLSPSSTSPAPEGHAQTSPTAKGPRARAGSCGSSTAVSEGGEASEGTVVDVDIEPVASHSDPKGKRKAVEIEEHDAVQPEEAPTLVNAAPVEKTQGAAKGGKKSRAKANPRPRKRVKVDNPLEPAHGDPSVVAAATGGENVPPVTTESKTAQKKRTASGSARKKSAARKA